MSPGGVVNVILSSKPLRHVLLAFGVFALALQLNLLVKSFSDTEALGLDGAQIWGQAERIRADAPLYSPMPDYGPHVMTGDVKYPVVENSPYLPPLGALISLAPRVDPLMFSRGHLIVVVLLTWLFAAMLCRLACGYVDWRGWLIAMGVLMLFPGSFQVLADNNIEPLLWSLFGAAYLYPRYRVAFLVVIGGVKVHAVWPLLALLIQNPRSARTAAVPAIIIVGVVVLAMGITGSSAAFVDWFRFIPPALGQGTFLEQNASISFFPLRVARWVGWRYDSGPLSNLPRAWLLILSIGAPASAIWFTRRSSAQKRMAVVMAAALLAAPLCWAGYLAALLAPAAWWIGQHYHSLRLDSQRELDLRPASAL